MKLLQEDAAYHSSLINHLKLVDQKEVEKQQRKKEK